MKYSLPPIVVTALLLGVGPALAQESGRLNVQTVVQKQEIVVGENGKQRTQLVPAAKVVPGDVVVYTITYTNISDESAENVVVTNPISSDLTYVDESAFGPGSRIDFSVDGGTTYATAEELTVTEDGITRAAQPADYTHIRWSMADDLAAGAQGIARFKARLN